MFYFEYMEGKISYSVHRSSISLCSVGISVGFYHRNYDSTTPVGDTVCGFYFNIGLYEGRIWVQQYLRAYSTIFYSVIFIRTTWLRSCFSNYSFEQVYRSDKESWMNSPMVALTSIDIATLNNLLTSSKALILISTWVNIYNILFL